MRQRKWFPWWVIGLFCLGVLGYGLLQTRLPVVLAAWYVPMANQERWQPRSVWLSDYAVQIEAQAIPEIEDNASGLTYSSASNTLYTVINQPAAIAELDTNGRLLRKLPLTGVRDPEGISHVEGDLFVIADEHDQKLYFVRLRHGAESVDVRDAPQIGIALQQNRRNRGFEGASWDEDGQRLFVSEEMLPLRVLEIGGIDKLLRQERMDLQIGQWPFTWLSTVLLHDLSSLTLHGATGTLLLLSDESALLAEYSLEGELVSVLPLLKGWHGLRRTVPQAEGVALGPDGTVFILSEPNLFYTFVRTDDY